MQAFQVVFDDETTITVVASSISMVEFVYRDQRHHRDEREIVSINTIPGDTFVQRVPEDE